MKFTTKLIALIVLVTILTSLFVGCAKDELTLFDAMNKTNNINSFESKTDLSFNMNASNLPEAEQEKFNEISKVLNGLKFTLTQRTMQNDDKTAVKSQIGALVGIQGMTMDTSVWVDADFSGEKFILKEIVKLPLLATLSMPPEFRGKEYIVIDFDSLTGIQDSQAKDLKKTVEFGKEFEKKWTEFLKRYALQFNPGFEVAKLKGTKQVSGESQTVYEVRLDDRSFKVLSKYFVSNLLENKEGIQLLKDYLLAVYQASASASGESSADKAVMDEMFKSIDAELPKAAEQVNKFFDAFKDVKLIGDRGITFTYGINKNGYVVSTSGVIDLVLDVKAIESAVKTLNPASEKQLPDGSKSSGIVSLSINFNTELSNINQVIDIKFPELNSDNSLNIFDIMESNRKKFEDMKEPLPAYDPEIPSIVVNDEFIAMSSDPQIIDGNIMVPVRDVLSAIGAKVSWDAATQTILCSKDAKVLTFKIDSKEAAVNGSALSLPTPAVLIHGKTYVPLRFVCENLGAEVTWDEASNTAIITSK